MLDKPIELISQQLAPLSKPPSQRRRKRAEAEADAPKIFFRDYPGSRRPGEKIAYTKRDKNQRP